MKTHPPLHGLNCRVTQADRNSTDEQLLHAYVYVDKKIKGKIVSTYFLGKNQVMFKMRSLVACLMQPLGVTYLGDPPLTHSSPIFPRKLIIGTGSLPANPTDEALDEPLQLGGSDIEFPLESTLAYASPGSYGLDPISITYFFNIPEGQEFDAVGGGITTNVTITEWGMLTDGDQYLTNRRVRTISKPAEASLTLRWEIRT